MQLRPRMVFLLVAIAVGFADIVPLAAQAQTPLINEFMSSNAATIADDDGDYSDWLEIHNPGAAAYDLTACYLSDSAGNPLRWQFPACSIPAGGFLLVWASGKDKVGIAGQLHTNFSISADGEPLLLTAADGATRLDEVDPVALPPDVSFGRLPDAAAMWALFGVPTPGAPNAGGLQYLPSPVFSAAPGYYDAPVTLAIEASAPDVLVTYTLDGSEPTLASAPFTEPLVLGSREGDPNVISLIPTNNMPDWHIGWRPPRNEVFKLNLVRARAFRAGHAPSAIACGSYIVGDDLAARLPLAVVSLASDPAHLFSAETGIYVPGVHYIPGNHGTGNYYQRGEAWERPVHLELFDRQGELLLAQDAGMRIHGNFTRRFPQKSLKMFARSDYGPSTFTAPLFTGLAAAPYKRFVLRNSGNDWGYMGFKDLVIQTMVAGMGFDTQAGRPALHFINGEYWGIANLREDYDRHYLERVWNVPEDEIVLLVNNATLEEGLPGDQQHYLDLRTYVATSDMTLPNSLAYVTERMDVANFIAYMTAEIYFDNRDWPGNNIRYWRRRTAAYEPDAPPGHDGRWRWLMYDMDLTLPDDYWFNTLEHALATDGPSWPNPPWSTELLRGLLVNPQFRHDFITSFADHLNSTLRPNRLLAIMDAFADEYAPAITDNQDRWRLNINFPAVVEGRRTFMSQRPYYLRQHLLQRFGLPGLATVQLSVNDPQQGTLQINSLRIDADLPGLEDPQVPYPWQGTYFQGVPVTVTALPAPGFRFVAWHPSGDAEPTFTFTPGSEQTTLLAVFERDPAAVVMIHYWHFNDLPAGPLTSVPVDLTLVGQPVITYPGSGAGYLDRVAGADLNAEPDIPAGYGLRVRNPSDTRELKIELPTTGYTDVVLSLALWRSANGAQEVTLAYAALPADDAWVAFGPAITTTETPQLQTWDFTGLAAAANNSHFRVRLMFGGDNAGGTEGNTRYDNIKLTGRLWDGPTTTPDLPAGLPLAVRVHPNPFNPAVTIAFELPAAGPVTLAIFDVAGRRVRTVLQCANHPAGRSTAHWDGRSDAGQAVASGVYVCWLQTTGGTVTRKLQLLR